MSRLYLKDLTLADVFTANKYSFGVLVNLHTLTWAGTTNYYAGTDVILGTDTAYFGVGGGTDSGDHIFFMHYDTNERTVRVPCKTNKWIFVHGAYDSAVGSGTMYFGYNGIITTRRTGVGALGDTTGRLISGYSPWATAGFDGEKLAQYTLPNVALIDSTLMQIKEELERKFDLDLPSPLPPSIVVESASRPRMHPARITERRQNIAPISAAPATPLITHTRYPEPDHSRRQRRDMITQAYAVALRERTKQIAIVERPERVVRPMFRAADQQVMARSMAPERTTTNFEVDAPDRVTRPMFRAADQQALDARNRAPERIAQMAIVDEPERIVRPFFRAVDHQALTTIPPQPERQQPAFDAHGPARVFRPFFVVTHQQPFTTVPAQPERKTHFDVIEPERIVRPQLLTASHQHVLSIPPQPEQPHARTWHTSHPDRVFRPTTPAALQPFFAMHPQPERPTVFFDAIAPERVLRPTLATAQQPARAEMPHAPERTTTFFDFQGPARVTRPSYESARQQPYASSIAPERTLPLAWSPGFVDAVTRAKVHASVQPFFAMWPVPLPTAALTQLTPILTLAPERVLRPTFPPAQQQPSNPLPPRLLVNVYNPRIDAPDRVARPMFPSTSQLDLARMPPASERPVAFFEADFPDRPTRAVYTTAQHQMMPLPHAPERTTTFFTLVAFPDRIPRAMAQQQMTPSRQPHPPDRARPFFDALVPERVRRAFLAPAQHVAQLSISPRPERKAPLAWVSCDVPPVRPRAQQVTIVSTGLVDQTPPLDFYAHAPARVERARLVMGDIASPIVQPAPVAPLLVLALYPDHVTRPWAPITRARWVLDFEEPPEPEPPVITGITGGLVPHPEVDGEVVVVAREGGGLAVKLAGAGALEGKDAAKGGIVPKGTSGGGLTARKGIGGKLGK